MNPYVGQSASDALKAILSDKPLPDRLADAVSAFRHVSTDYYFKDINPDSVDILRRLQSGESEDIATDVRHAIESILRQHGQEYQL